MKVRLYRIGTDPEFVFGTLIDGVVTVVPAIDIVSFTKEKHLNTFIGTDNHGCTAELRPAPAHNIYRVLYEMAQAIDHMDGWLKQKPRDGKIYLFAHPSLPSPPGHTNQGGEHMGGHIHTSMFVEDPLLLSLYKNNLVVTVSNENGPIEKWDPNLPIGAGHLDFLALSNKVNQRKKKGDLFTPIVYARTLNWLLLPFERYVQNWQLRLIRNGHYGGHEGDKMVRVNVSHPPANMGERFANCAYLHYEYRMPSTWMTHPWLAYAYFALVKITMQNFDKVFEAAKSSKLSDIAEYEKIAGNNGSYRTLFEERFSALQNAGLRISNDCADFLTALDKVAQNRAQWVQPNMPIDVAAWRTVLG